jgi:hypothetical protein
MKIKDILLESPTDIVARHYIEASQKFDKFYNPEDVKYKEKNHKYYDEHFKQWFNEEIVPVFTKPTQRPQAEWTNTPKEGKIQSPGYRGREYALARAGLPYDKNVQRYQTNLGNVWAPSTMVASRANNGQ